MADQKEQRDRAVVEYGMIVSLMLVAAIAVLVVFGTQVGDVLELIATRIHE
jgi:Flp pilus assembly pilin Flp